MGLINQKTDLKSLKYSQTSSRDKPYPNSPDYLVRGGIILPFRIKEDVFRLTKYFGTTSGKLFQIKQNLISNFQQKNPFNKDSLTKSESPSVPYFYASPTTIAQAALTPIGARLPLFMNFNLDKEKYFNIVTNKEIKDNRLINLKNNFKDEVIQSPILNNKNVYDTLKKVLNKQSIKEFTNKDRNKSSSEIFNTNITRIDYSNNFLFGSYVKWDKSKQETPPRLNLNQVNPKQPEREPGKEIEDFNLKTKKYTKNNILYQRLKIGQPGKNYPEKTRDYIFYNTNNSLGIDELTKSGIYEDKDYKTENEYADLINFNIAILQNNTPGKNWYVHFRAFIDSFNESYNADWNSFNYAGRGEKFYSYGGFERKINLSFTVHSQSREELIPMYRKLNFLASSLAPSYSSMGFMRGNLARLTIGDYLNHQLGIITGFNYDIPDESPWEIAINENGQRNTNFSQLPHIIKVSSFSFIPIHEFIPQIGNPEELEKTGFISLTDGKGGTFLNKNTNPQYLNKSQNNNNPSPAF